MMDRLDDFMEKNNGGFDSLNPSVGSWEKISGSIETPNRFLKARFVSMVSAVAGIAVVFAVVFFSVFNDSINLDVKVAGQDTGVSEAEAYYLNQVSQRKHAIYKVSSEHQALVNEMDRDMEALDSVLIELKRDLKDDVSNAEVVEAMIQNYRMKLMILDDILSFIESQNNEEDKIMTYEM